MSRAAEVAATPLAEDLMADTRLEPADMGKVPFLADLLPAEAEALCAAGDLVTHADGEAIFRQGDPGQELYVVIDGEVAIEIDVPGGAPQRLACLAEGTIFGEVNFLLASARTATARANGPTRLLVFRRDRLETLEGIGRQALSNVMETVARVLALRLSNMDRDLAETCARLAQEGSDAGELLRGLSERRQPGLFAWHY